MSYEPLPPPQSVEAELAKYLMDELLRVSEEFLNITEIRLVELRVEPAKPRDGQVVLADGTNWNPGSGAGFYGRRGGAWQLLG